VLVSAATGEGIDRLRQAIDEWLGAKDEVLTVQVPATAGRLLSWLHANTDVVREQTAETGTVTARSRIDPAAWGKLEGELKRAGVEVDARKGSTRLRKKKPHLQEGDGVLGERRQKL